MPRLKVLAIADSGHAGLQWGGKIILFSLALDTTPRSLSKDGRWFRLFPESTERAARRVTVELRASNNDAPDTALHIRRVGGSAADGTGSRCHQWT
eukprot:1402488-Rhodomonas_salina.2